jgi:hypothetical protein
VDAEDREDAIVAAVKRGHKAVIVGYRRVSEGLNLQIIDSIIWVEMAQHLILLTQASQRAWRRGKQEEVRIFYLAYAGTVSHDKLKQLASQGGAAALFSGNAPQGGLAQHVGADHGALAQITQKLGTANELSVAFPRRHAELASAIAAGRDWLGIDHDSLPTVWPSFEQRHPDRSGRRPLCPRYSPPETANRSRLSQQPKGRWGRRRPSPSATSPISARPCAPHARPAVRIWSSRPSFQPPMFDL